MQTVPKTLSDKLRDLEDHLYLLEQDLRGLEAGEVAHLRGMSVELRALVCYSSRTEGLLWRVCEELGVEPLVFLHEIIDTTDSPHAATRRMRFSRIASAGCGRPYRPVRAYSLRDLLKNREAVFVAGRSVTHERLIKWAAENAVWINGVQPLVQILDSDALAVLEAGETIITLAVELGPYARFREPAPRRLNPSYPRQLNLAQFPGPIAEPLNEQTWTQLVALEADDPEWAAAPREYRFPPMKAGSTVVQVTKHADATLSVRIEFQKSGVVDVRVPLPAGVKGDCVLALAWNRPTIIIHLGHPHGLQQLWSGQVSQT
jgi:hypothetical protein